MNRIVQRQSAAFFISVARPGRTVFEFEFAVVCYRKHYTGRRDAVSLAAVVDAGTCVHSDLETFLEEERNSKLEWLH